ncbi:MAG: superoxide dismutase family protein [Burkholderiales bacterium]
MKLASVAVAFAAIAVAGCANMHMPSDGPKATAKLEPTKGNNVTGDVTFTQKGSRVAVAGEVRGLQPNKEHGFHVHEKGDCSSGDGMSAGGHFNPQGVAHGNHAMGTHHAGDMPNMKADATGVAVIAWEDDVLTVTEGSTTVVGRALIVHRDPDDYKSQPAGNSGPRLACGVITKS